MRGKRWGRGTAGRGGRGRVSPTGPAYLSVVLFPPGPAPLLAGPPSRRPHALVAVPLAPSPGVCSV